MTVDDRYQSALYEKARKAFVASVRADTFSVPPDKIDQAVKIAKVKDRADRITRKAEAHFERRKGRAVQREYSKLMRENPMKAANDLSRGPKPPALGPSREHLHRERMMDRAEKTVRLNHLRRLDSIDRAKNSMTRSITLSRNNQLRRSR